MINFGFKIRAFLEKMSWVKSAKKVIFWGQKLGLIRGFGKVRVRMALKRL